MSHLSYLFLVCIVMGFSSAYATTNQQADPSALGPEGSILRIMPPEKFSVDNRLQKNVDFWVRIYTQYHTRQALIHDARYIDKIYEVVELKDMDSKQSGRLIKELKKKWKAILLSVQHKHAHPEAMNEEERHIFNMFSDISEPNKFQNAAHRKRLRYQLGQRDQFLRGLFDSGRYIPLMEEIFRKEKLPVELTRLPFVESSFNVRARSKVGASGIWQFMRSTGRLFLKINDAIDERNDPIRATEAAAQLMKLNFDSLRNWSLAVTAYNHGRKGMMRAVRKVGSEELEDVVGAYRSRSFGFASSNFFTELLAAIEVEKNAEKYFGKVERDKPLDFIEAKIPDYIELKHLAQFLKQEPEVLRQYNPAFSESILAGERLVPAGYLLRLPYSAQVSKDDTLKAFWETYAQIPDEFKLKAQVRDKYGRRSKQARR